MKRRFAQSGSDLPRETFTSRNHENRMNAGDLRARGNQLHNFRVTGLCTGCTRLMNKKLQTHEFH